MRGERTTSDGYAKCDCGGRQQMGVGYSSNRGSKTLILRPPQQTQNTVTASRPTANGFLEQFSFTIWREQQTIETSAIASSVVICAQFYVCLGYACQLPSMGRRIPLKSYQKGIRSDQNAVECMPTNKIGGRTLRRRCLLRDSVCGIERASPVCELLLKVCAKAFGQCPWCDKSS